MRSTENDDASGGRAEDTPLAEAVKLHRAGRLKDAERIYRSILSGNPDDPDAVHFLGVLMHHDGRGPEAVDWIRKSIALRPDHAETHNNLGNVLKEQGKLDEAEAAYQRAIELDPGLSLAYINLGAILRQTGRLEQAVAAYDWAVAIDPSHADTHFRRGEALRLMARFEEARVAYHRALALQPDHVAASSILGQVLYRLGRIGEARQVFRQWLEHDPENAFARHMLAACGGDETPDRAADGYVASLFDNCAAEYDENLRNLDYRVPELIASLLADHMGGPRNGLAVLDAGCGTGLCGPTLRPYASRLTGVDLSSAMLERAGSLQVYDELIRSELTAHLNGQEAAYDLIVAADTFVYFGELGKLVVAARRSLRPGGSLAFTVERTDEEPHRGFRLDPHGRYSHARAYLERVVAESGLNLRTIHSGVLRNEGQQPVQGWIVLARRESSSA
jgi:predicted TPR repeat methyltransferase